MLRQRSRRLEAKPKPVYVVQFQDFAGVSKRPDLRAELDDIIDCVERGKGVAEAYYRAGIDRDDDQLLVDQGIMHLHLGGKDSDVLVFLIQYADRVVLLETNTHIHFRTKPAGKNILALTQAWLRDLESDMNSAAEQAATAATEAERKAAKELHDKRAIAIAAFKVKAKLD